MRIADRHIEWDARSVLTWQYDKAVNMIAFLSLWQKWIDLNCNKVFYGSETRKVTADNCSDYGYSTLKDAFDTTDKDIIVKYVTVDALKSVLIAIAQTWKDTDTKNEQTDEKTGSTIIKTQGRAMVKHIGDMFTLRDKKLYKYSVDSDGSITKEQVNASEDDSYDWVEDTYEKTVSKYTNAEITRSVAGTGFWFETEYEYTYVTWNGEQWVTCPTYNHEYAGGWFADIYAIDTCNEFGLLLWAKLIGVELPAVYGTESTKSVDEYDEQNEVWRTYLKARFYRILTNGSMNDIVAYLHSVFAQFDNHEIQVEDGGSYELGSVNGDKFNEAFNTETDSSGNVTSGYVCTIVEVDPNDATHKAWDVADKSLDTFRNAETIIKVGYKVNVTDVSAPTAEPKETTVVSIGNDCITVSHSELGTKTCENKVKVKFLGDWKEGCEITSVADDSMTVKDASGAESDTVKSVCVYSEEEEEWCEGYTVVGLNTDGTVRLIYKLGGYSNVAQGNIKVHFYGDWEDGYSVDEVVSDSEIVVVDEGGAQKNTVNDVCVYNSTADVYDEGYVVDSVDHSSFCVADADGIKSFAENQYVTMAKFADIKYYGVKLMTIKYSCEFDQNDIERAILNISDFLPHPSAVLSENTMFAGEDIVFGFNSHNYNDKCLPTVVSGTDGNSYYVYPYQDFEESDCDIPVELKVVGDRNASVSYLTEKESITQRLRAEREIGSFDNIFVCHVVGTNGEKCAAKWAVGTKFDCHLNGDEAKDEVSKFVGQTALYKYNSDGTVMTGIAMTPVMYDELVNDAKLQGYIRKVAKYNGKWCYYDGKYDPTSVNVSKWKELTVKTTTTDGVTTKTYSYDYYQYGSTTAQTYEVEFDESGEPKYINVELRCYKNHSEAQNAIARIESYNDDNGDVTPLVVSSNQNIANTQTVSYAGDFFNRYLMLKNEELAALIWKEFNLFGRKDIDPKNGGYFKGGEDSTPVGLTEIVRILMPLSTNVTKGADGKNYARNFELWHKNTIQRLGTMMKEVDARKVWATDSDTSEDSYLHTTEFNDNGVFVASTNIMHANRMKTTEYVGLKIKYTRTDRNPRKESDAEYIKYLDETTKTRVDTINTHAVNELFLLENGTAYEKSPESGTYIVDFVNTSVKVNDAVGYEHVFKGVRFLYKLKDGESDDDTTLPWATRLAKYRRLTMDDVGGTGSADLIPGTNAVLMPTCDYGFMKYNFVNVTEVDELGTPNVWYYYGYGLVDDTTDTTGGKAIPTPDGSSKTQVYDDEINLFELWGQNQLMTMNNGGLSST
jgi:hypothetical protein